MADQKMINAVAANTPRELANSTCSVAPLLVCLADHKADTLQRVTARAEAFAARESGGAAKNLLAGGDAGVEVAVNAFMFLGNMLAALVLVPALLLVLQLRSRRTAAAPGHKAAPLRA